MVRPKADAPGPSAKERMERAFWTMLSKEDFSDMTIKGLAKRARVNLNTVYRYNDSLLDFAIKQVSGAPAEAMAKDVIGHIKKQ